MRSELIVAALLIAVATAPLASAPHNGLEDEIGGSTHDAVSCWTPYVDEITDTVREWKCWALHKVSFHRPIHIDGDDGDPDCTEVGDECTDFEHGIRGGDGSKADPYVIRDWKIVSPTDPDATGIRIEDTQDHLLVLRNRIPTATGISLEDAPNVRVQDNHLETTKIGIEVTARTTAGQQGDLDAPLGNYPHDGPILRGNDIVARSGDGFHLDNWGGDDGQIWVWNNRIRVEGVGDGITGSRWDYEIRRNEIGLAKGDAVALDLDFMETKSRIYDNTIGYDGSAWTGVDTQIIDIDTGGVHRLEGNTVDGNVEIHGGQIILWETRIDGKIRATSPERLCVCDGTVIRDPWAEPSVIVDGGAEADILDADVGGDYARDEGVVALHGTDEVDVRRSTVRCGSATSTGVYARNVGSLTVLNNDFPGCSTEVDEG